MQDDLPTDPSEHLLADRDYDEHFALIDAYVNALDGAENSVNAARH